MTASSGYIHKYKVYFSLAFTIYRTKKTNSLKNLAKTKRIYIEKNHCNNLDRPNRFWLYAAGTVRSIAQLEIISGKPNVIRLQAHKSC